MVSVGVPKALQRSEVLSWLDRKVHSVSAPDEEGRKGEEGEGMAYITCPLKVCGVPTSKNTLKMQPSEHAGNTDVWRRGSKTGSWLG